MESDLSFAKFVLEELRESHPFFRYPLLTSGDYEPYLHQAEIFYRLLVRDPVRFLIADDVGLGKTIEGVMVIDQLVKRRNARRILLVLPRVLVGQWAYELNRFRREWGLPVIEYDRDTQVGSEGIYLVSVDTFKRESHREKFLGNSWDLVVADEVHKIGVVGSKENMRYKAMAELVGKSSNSNFLGLSATPHRGNDNDYLKRLNLVDPYLKEADDKLLRMTVRAIVQKRNKNNVNEVYENDKIFPDAVFVQYVVEPTPEEKEYYSKIRELTLTILKEYYNKMGKAPKGLPLLSFMIGRRALSSPYAGLETFKNMIERRAALTYEDVEELAEAYAEEEEMEEEIEPDELANEYVARTLKDLQKLGHEFLGKFEDEVKQLVELAKKVMENDSRVRALAELVKTHLDRGDKVIVFTEYKDTANYITSSLKRELNLSDDRIKVVTSETLKKEGIERVKGWLNRGGAKVMVATDVASEGLNLQSANVLIHNELPLSIVKFEQRNGRVWRLKQSKTVYIYYLALNTEIDQAILNNYYNKLLEVTKGTGSEVKVADALVYKGGKVNRVFNLSEEKESVPVYLAYNDPQNREGEITPLKVWERIVQGDIDNMVGEMLARIKRLKDTMRKFALYDKLQGAAVMDIDTVRKIAGFANRSELRSSLQKLMDSLLRKVGGKVEGNKVYFMGKIIDDYDASRIGVMITAIDQVISHATRDKRAFVVCDGLDRNFYLTRVKVTVNGREALSMPYVVDSALQEVPLSKFLSEVLPKTFECRKVYPDDVEVELNKNKIIFEAKQRVTKLLQSYIMYRQERGKDSWYPKGVDDVKLDVEVRGGVIGVGGSNDNFEFKVLEALKKRGTVSPAEGGYRLEGKGEVRYLRIVKPNEIFSRDRSFWLYTYSNGALVGVRNG